ncbi:RND family efflux transporter, MFP subunit [Balnearium lithotrophicum]|uniref:RND family efflux transporter, MFP subunit n=1 Tax=Balnearium lithotrophicum TaxID=223788 RepID=A0A521DAI6_9BACT|nr:efflux RND transporter periplasmic adaptor subunit [Balnearium lithotrophicum]SMO68091.1 RND family efflux transporter, MFP subunit [Balnearium lithotrophicum]
MKSSKAILVLVILIALGVVVGKVLIKKRRVELLSYTPPKSYPLPVEYAVVKRGNINERFKYLGQVLPYTYASISTKVSGTVLKVYKREGEHFKKGELLARIDSSEIENTILALENQKKAKESLLKGLESQLKAAEVAEKNARNEYERELFLFRRGAVPKEAVEKYQNLYESAKARVETIKSQMRELKHAIISIEKQEKSVASKLKYTEIRALKSGTVANVLLYPGDEALPGKPIMKVFYDSDGFRVLVNVPPRDARETELGSPVKVEGLEIGRVEKIYPAANQKNSLYTVEIRLNKLKGIKPGELVETVLEGKSYEGFVLPYSAILHLKDGSYVLTVQGHSVKAVPVKVIKRVNNRVVVSGNLLEGEKVVVGRESKLLEVLRVKNVNLVEAFNG